MDVGAICVLHPATSLLPLSATTTARQPTITKQLASTLLVPLLLCCCCCCCCFCLSLITHSCLVLCLSCSLFLTPKQGVFPGGDLSDSFLKEIYDRIKSRELKTGLDHVSQVSLSLPLFLAFFSCLSFLSLLHCILSFPAPLSLVHKSHVCLSHVMRRLFVVVSLLLLLLFCDRRLLLSAAAAAHQATRAELPSHAGPDACGWNVNCRRPSDAMIAI